MNIFLWNGNHLTGKNIALLNSNKLSIESAIGNIMEEKKQNNDQRWKKL